MGYMLMMSGFGLFILLIVLVFIPISEVKKVVSEFPKELIGSDYGYTETLFNIIYKYQIIVYNRNGRIIQEYGVLRWSKLHNELETS